MSEIKIKAEVVSLGKQETNVNVLKLDNENNYVVLLTDINTNKRVGIEICNEQGLSILEKLCSGLREQMNLNEEKISLCPNLVKLKDKILEENKGFSTYQAFDLAIKMLSKKQEKQD